MTVYPVQGPPAVVVFDEEFEQMVRDGADEIFVALSDPLKAALNEKIDKVIESAVPVLTSPLTVSVTYSSPEPLATTLTNRIQSSVEAVSKKIAHRCVDKSGDCSRNTLSRSIDTCADSRRSFLSWITRSTSR